MMMARGFALAIAVWATATLLRVSHTFERYSVLDEPRGTAVLALGVATGLVWLLGYFSERIPGLRDARAEGNGPSTKPNPAVSVPKRPRRMFNLMLACCVLVRLEIFLSVAHQEQCSAPGIELFLCIPLVVYEAFVIPIVDSVVEESDDPWGSVLDDLAQWASTAKVLLLIGVIMLSAGAHSSVSQGKASTYFCATLHDSPVWTVFLQAVGLGIDAAVAVLLWRILWWSKTTKTRLHALFEILRACCAVETGIFLLETLFGLVHLGDVYFWDALRDGLLLSAFLVSICLLMCESSPLTPISIIIATTGVIASFDNVSRISTWLHSTRSETLTPVYLVCFGFAMILSTNHMRPLTILGRLGIALVLVATLTTCLIITVLNGKPQTFNRHPINDQIYRARIEMDRWLTKSSTSQSLRIAVQEYQERNRGRNPPPKFDIWYQFAKERKSVIIDHFEQISSDILPFWGLDPKTIRDRVNELEGRPDISMIRVRDGSVAVDNVPGTQHPDSVDQLMYMIAACAPHLSNMDIPVNILEQPRALAPSANTQRLEALASRKRFNIGSREEGRSKSPDPSYWASTSLAAFHNMAAQACPAGSKARSRSAWTVRNEQYTYYRSFSKGAILTNWGRSLETCSQPDMTRLHGFHMSTPAIRKPYTKLLPIFSRAKTDGYRDIIIPLPRPQDDAQDTPRSFSSRRNALYWRGSYGDPTAGYTALRGNHKHRFARLVNNSTSSDTTTFLLPMRKQSAKKHFTYEVVPTTDLNRALPFDVAFDPESCPDPSYPACQEFGTREPAEEAMTNRYLLVLDDDAGPSTSVSTIGALRSGSVPFVGTIFREWYTERIRPWVHFVPIDIRLHGLHSTFAYFTGIKAKSKPAANEGDSEPQQGAPGAEMLETAKTKVAAAQPPVVTIGGRLVEMKPATNDAKWIASQGRSWAQKALRKEDMEVYVFRLLLEWGRVINDDRDSIGFVFEGQ